MKHLFLPYELALIAKEKGFDEPCMAMYTVPDDGSKVCFAMFGDYEFPMKQYSEAFNNYNSNDEFIETISAPLYQQIIDWFIEKHEIYIWTEYDTIPDDGDGWEQGEVYRMQKKDSGGRSSRSHLPKYKAYNYLIDEAFKLIP